MECRKPDGNAFFFYFLRLERKLLAAKQRDEVWDS